MDNNSDNRYYRRSANRHVRRMPSPDLYRMNNRIYSPLLFHSNHLFQYDPYSHFNRHNYCMHANYHNQQNFQRNNKNNLNLKNFMNSYNENKDDYPTIFTLIYSILMIIIGLALFILQVLLLTNSDYLANVSIGIWIGIYFIFSVVPGLIRSI